MSAHRLFLLTALALFVSAPLLAQQKEIKRVPMKPTSPVSGEEMYKSYCAVCHGFDGKGNGPAADALKAPPADLTLLSQHNQGKFPAGHVASAISGEASISAHGSKDMPVWGPLFRQMSQGHHEQVQLRIVNLTKYLETLQVK